VGPLQRGEKEIRRLCGEVIERQNQTSILDYFDKAIINDDVVA